MIQTSASLPELFCRSFGHGPRKVLALHCTIAHSGAWRGVAERIADEVTLITPDNLSHGRSCDWDRRGDYQDQSVAVTLPYLKEPMDIIGHSFGAIVALRLAVEHPELVRSLTMIEPVYFAVALLDAPDMLSEHNERAAPFINALAEGNDALGARLFNRMWSTVDNPKWPDLPEATRAAMTRSIHVVTAQHASLFDDRPGMLKPGVLDRVAMPTLLLQGGESPAIMGVINRGLVARLPNAKNTVIKGAGHMLPITHPQETATAIRELFKRAQI